MWSILGFPWRIPRFYPKIQVWSPASPLVWSINKQTNLKNLSVSKRKDSSVVRDLSLILCGPWNITNCSPGGSKLCWEWTWILWVTNRLSLMDPVTIGHSSSQLWPWLWISGLIGWGSPPFPTPILVWPQRILVWPRGRPRGENTCGSCRPTRELWGGVEGTWRLPSVSFPFNVFRSL